MRIYLSSLASVSKPLKSFVVKAVNSGFNNIEILDEWGHRLNDRKVQELVELKRSYYLNYVVHAPYDGINVSTPQRALRRMSLKLIERSMNYAHYLEAKLVVVHSGFKSPLDYLKPGTSWNLFLKTLKRLNKLADDLDIYIGIENMPSGTNAIIQSCEEALMLIEEMWALDKVGLTLDVGHSNTISIHETQNYLLKAGKHLLHMHLHDNNGYVDSHLAVGSGMIDWASIAPLIKELKLVGGLTIEVMRFKDAKKSFDFITRMLR
ncbi:MAG: sugar phosphate isomerase/epimerase [Candidatus Nezhaarchaeota archaeon]|nr:sugar phosphate isomerase/epimerase [Candidatus Nezhaarchaeota archaeon]